MRGQQLQQARNGDISTSIIIVRQEMESRNEDSSCVQRNGCTDEGDADKQRIVETFSQHNIRGTTIVTVRELRSEGLSFQLWPVANAMCLYIEKECGEGGMSVIDARPPQFEWDIARWCSSSAVVPETNLALGDSLSEGLENLVVDSKISSVNDNVVDLGNRFVREKRQSPNSNGRPKAKVLDDTGKPLASRNICNEMDPLHLQGIQRRLPSRNGGNQMDPLVANFESNHEPALNCIERNGTHIVHKSIGIAEAGGNFYFPKRRMRVLELGSGTGMVGIVAACLGADVVLTDLPQVINNVSHNLDLNKSIIAAAGGRVEAKVLRWGVEEDVEALGGRFFDLILASDCVYYDTSYKPFLDTLTWLMRAPGRNHTDVTTVQQVPQRKPTIPKTVSSALPSQIPESAFSLFPASKGVILVAIDNVDKEVSGKDIDEQSASQIDTPTNTKEQGGNECVILLGHMRRWKKDSKFFRMASKVFNVSIIHRHPPEANERIGPIVYRFSKKLDRKTDSSRTRSSSSIGSLPSSSPPRR